MLYRYTCGLLTWALATGLVAGQSQTTTGKPGTNAPVPRVAPELVPGYQPRVIAGFTDG
jgi:hypothetical protein